MDELPELWSTAVRTNTFARRTSHQLLLWDRPKVAHSNDAQGQRARGLLCRTLGPEGQSAGEEFRVTSLNSPILSMKRLVKQGYKFEAGPGKMSKGDRSATLDVVKIFFGAKAYTTAMLKQDLFHHRRMGYLKNYCENYCV